MLCRTVFVASFIVLADRGAPLSRGRGGRRAAHDRPPVIIVPGSLHSRLAVRAQRDNAQCEGTGDNASEVAYVNWTQWRSRQSQRCWIDRMSLRLTTGQRFISPQGVDIEVIDGPTSDKFGSLSALPACDPWTCPEPSTYIAFIQALITGGYEPGNTLLMAPYDWRHAPGVELDPYCDALAQLVARTVQRHGQVVLAGHSAGPPLIGYCLRRQPAEWRKTNLHGMLSLNGLIGGEIDCLETLWRGGDFLNAAEGVTTWDRASYRSAQWSWGVTAWCLPQPSLYGNRSLLTIGERYFSANTLPAAIRLLGSEAVESIGQVLPLVVNSTPPDAGPGVQVWCLYGVGVRTPVHYTFADGNLSRPPVVTWGDGDGQQPTESNSACMRWQGENGHNVTVRTFTGADHDSLLADERMHRFVLDHVLVPRPVHDR